jgi:signal transduction histidine kinase/ActR/RegA family two-component response regulator
MGSPLALPTGLARRFALSAAGLAAAALLLITLVSSWIIDQQHEAALGELASRERQFHAAAVSSDLNALHARMTEMAGSTILATGLVDSAGRETYLQPFLGGVRQINGVPVQVLFTDFEGKEIASNPGASFTPDELAWLRRQLEQGRAAAAIFGGGADAQLLAMQPLVYSRTRSPEGALLYKVRLADLHAGATMPLQWKGSEVAGETVTPVMAPEVMQALGFTIRGSRPSPGTRSDMSLAPQALPILIVALLLFSVVALVGSRLAAHLTRDLRQLEGFAREVTGTGLTHERAQETGSAEVRGLAASMNRMLDRLQQQQEAIVAEGGKLAELATALRMVNRRKDEFLAMLAHELRNPLAPIATGARLLQTAAGDPERVARTSAVIARQAEHMAKLVDDLLDVSRVTRGLITLDKRAVNFNEVVAAAADQARPLVQQKGHELAIDLPAAPLWVEGDAARLVQVVSNLLHNAAKYTPERGRIAVTLQPSGDGLRLAVADNGIGISTDLMPEIFDLFTQGSRSSDRSQGGLGLGLALVRNLVELHGGRVFAYSEGADRGSTFSVELPRIEAPEQPPKVASRGDPCAGGPRRVLVVDDNVDAAQTLASLLEIDGHEVHVTYDASSALRIASRLAPDVFVLDIGLPDLDGNELARRLRASPAGRRAMLIALTGYGQPADREASREAGFDHHLVKPVDPARLAAILSGAHAQPAPAQATRA